MRAKSVGYGLNQYDSFTNTVFDDSASNKSFRSRRVSKVPISA